MSHTECVIPEPALKKYQMASIKRCIPTAVGLERQMFAVPFVITLVNDNLRWGDFVQLMNVLENRPYNI
jgi:hypothetical protein